MLNTMTLREYAPSDREQLVSLWCEVFEDPPELVGDFLRLLPEMGTCCVAVKGAQVLGAAYLIDGFTLQVPGQVSRRCGYLYAVAVRHNVRRGGIGAAVSRGSVALGRERGADLICTLPAEESLYRWYEKILSLNCRCTRTRRYADRLPSAAAPLSGPEYLMRRERILNRKAHVVPNPAAMEFQQCLCRSYGGGLYASGDAVFCAYREANRWVIPEYLPDPADSGQGGFSETVPYLCSDVPLPDGLIWNLTFD